MTEQFIEKAIKIHGNKYIYEKVDYKNAKDKVAITCRIHGDFLQAPNNHLRNQGCSKCGQEKKGLEQRSNTIEFIEKARKIHGDTYGYEHVVYVMVDECVDIVCKVHSIFQQKPKMHLAGYGCRRCNAGATKCTTEEFIEKANKIYNDIYDYSLTEYVGWDDYVNIICLKHGSFTVCAKKHLAGTGCFDCKNELVNNDKKFITTNENSKDKSKVAKRKLTIEDFIVKAKIVHGDKYSYEKSVYINMDTNIEIICKLHGSFWQRPDHHIAKNGCKKCTIGRHSNITTEEFIIRAKKVHGEEYNYEKSVYINGETKIEIICKIHGSFWQRPDHHNYSGSGCVDCSREKKGPDKLMESVIIERARQIHGNLYDYSKIVYTGFDDKITIICPKHKEFQQTVNVHLRGSGCPKCKMTTGEKFIYVFLQSKNINFVFQKKFDECVDVGKLSFDFYIPDKNFVIEYDGIQHFQPVDYFGGVKNFEITKKRDMIKNEFCLKNNIDMLRIPYTMARDDAIEIITNKLQ